MAFGVGGGGKVTVQIQSPYELGKTIVTETGVIAAGNGDTTDITPPDGELWEIFGLQMTVHAPNDTLSGSHYLDVKIYEPVHEELLMSLTKGASGHDSYLKFRYNHWHVADTEQYPDTEIAQIANVMGARISDEYPLSIFYKNDTNNSQSHSRVYELGYKKYYI